MNKETESKQGNYDLIRPFGETLLLSDYEDALTDYAELPLDQISKMVFSEAPDAFLELPIIKGAVAIGRLAWSIKSALVMRNQLSFIQSLRKNNPNVQAVEKRRKALENGEKWVIKEIEITLIYLERYADSYKTKYHARLYRDLLDEKITYEEYEEYLTIIESISISDISYFLDLLDYCVKNHKQEFRHQDLTDDSDLKFNHVRCRRLEFWGLINGIITTRMGTSYTDRYVMNDRGLYLYTVFHDENDKKHISFRIEPER